MAKYVDSEKLINKIDAYVINNQDVMFIRKLIADCEIEDVAPIIHCGDCKHVDTGMCPLYRAGFGYTDYDYCSCGTRIDEVRQ